MYRLPTSHVSTWGIYKRHKAAFLQFSVFLFRYYLHCLSDIAFIFFGLEDGHMVQAFFFKRYIMQLFSASAKGQLFSKTWDQF